MDLLDSSENEHIEIRSQSSLKELESKETIDWVLLEGYLIDVTDFDHPLGKFILFKANGMDLT